MAQALQNVRDIWQRTTLIQRVVLLAIVLAIGGASVLLVNWARKPQMALLYSGLAPEEAAKIVEKVRDGDTPYELKNGGTTIYVPSEKIYTLRLSMASQGLPNGDHAGYKILDDEKIGASPFTQHVNYIRAVEGELAKTIQLLEGVLSARVHVVKPESTLFAGKDKDASATVVLRLKSGWRMTPANVAAVVHLLAGSVEGLTPQKVVVVDSAGNLLSGEADNELAKRAGSFLDYKSQVEDYLARKAEDMLKAVLGPNRATVKVEAAIDTTALTSTTETFDPVKRVATKEETKTLSSQTGTADPKGGAAGAGLTKEETNTMEYQVTKTLESKTEIPGKLKTISVAAFIDLNPPPADPNNKNPVPAPTLTIKEAEEIIRTATGVGSRTGDTLKVVNASFHHPPAVEAAGVEEQKSNKEFYLEIASRGSLGLLVIGVLVALKLMKGGSKKSAATVAGATALAGQAPAGLLTGSELDMNPDLIRNQITQALQDNPEEVKRLFLSWVETEKGGA